MKIKYHILLTRNEPELIAFKKALPKGDFSKTVAIIINEALKDRVAVIPMNFEIAPVIENVHTKISLPEELIRKFCKKFGCRRGNLTTAIKEEMKKCVHKNLNIKPEKFCSSVNIKAIFDNVVNRVNEKKNSLCVDSEKSRLIEKEWRNAFYEMQNTVNRERNKK